jgi:hypothetical protein
MHAAVIGALGGLGFVLIRDICVSYVAAHGECESEIFKPRLYALYGVIGFVVGWLLGWLWSIG